MDGDLDCAAAGDSVTLTINADIDISRGDMLAADKARPVVAEQFAAHIIWMGNQPLLPGRSYFFLMGTFLHAQVTELKHKVNVTTREHIAAKHLDLNEIGFCNVALDRPVPFDPYTENRETGSFILIDRLNTPPLPAE